MIAKLNFSIVNLVTLGALACLMVGLATGVVGMEPAEFGDEYVTEFYDLSDMSGDELEAAVATIRASSGEDYWSETGGPASLEVFDGIVSVHHTVEQQLTIQGLLAE